MSRNVSPSELNEAINRLLLLPAISLEDWAVLNSVNRDTAFKAVKNDTVEGAYRVGHQIRVASAPWRARFGLKPSSPVEQVAA